MMDMAYRIESCHLMLENVAYQMQNGADASAPAKLAALIALTKVQCTRSFEFCAREAAQILGGAACVRGGPGARIERLYREVRVNAIGGGSEEVNGTPLCCAHGSPRIRGRVI
jgi:acyl-CoA dehydrogenase